MTFPVISNKCCHSCWHWSTLRPTTPYLRTLLNLKHLSLHERQSTCRPATWFPSGSSYSYVMMLVIVVVVVCIVCVTMPLTNPPRLLFFGVCSQANEIESNSSHMFVILCAPPASYACLPARQAVRCALGLAWTGDKDVMLWISNRYSTTLILNPSL